MTGGRGYELTSRWSLELRRKEIFTPGHVSYAIVILGYELVGTSGVVEGSNVIFSFLFNIISQCDFPSIPQSHIRIKRVLLLQPAF